MNTFESIKELNKYLRNMLVTQSEINSDKVLNALSIYGTELDKLLSESIYTSIDQLDSVILFELINRDSNSNVSFNEYEQTSLGTIDNNVTYYKCYTLKLIIYGDSSSDVANKIVARFRTEKVKEDLYENGIYLERVTDPISLNEFKNNTMWLRNDIDIDIGVKLKISQISTDSDFQSFSDLKIITK